MHIDEDDIVAEQEKEVERAQIEQEGIQDAAVHVGGEYKGGGAQGLDRYVVEQGHKLNKKSIFLASFSIKKLREAA